MSTKKSRNTDSFNLVWCWGLLAGFFVFYVLLKLSDFCIITFDRKISFQIDPTNLISIFITAYLALIVLRQLNRKDEGDRLERELYIESLREFYTRFNADIHTLTITSGIPGVTVASTIKNLTLALQEIITLISMSPCDNKENIDHLNRQFGKIRDLLSYVPDLSDESLEESDNVTIKDGKMIYSANYINQISNEIADFKKCIFLIILKINRS